MDKISLMEALKNGHKGVDGWINFTFHLLIIFALLVGFFQFYYDTVYWVIKVILGLPWWD